jgi:outer membrane protein OmpA-like peptidoglycan-associated protein
MPKDVRYLAAKKTKDGAIIHVSLLVAVDAMWTKKPVTLLEVIESKAMDSGMVTIDADTMAKGIDATGHMAIYGIYFDTDSDRIKEESSSTLNEIGKLLRGRPSLNLLVVGHTDSQGGYDYNTNLSQRRAEAVVKALVAAGIDQKRLKAAGVGYLSPVASNDQEVGRAKNRRVELVKH